jgi:hypothetical protein
MKLVLNAKFAEKALIIKAATISTLLHIVMKDLISASIAEKDMYLKRC